MRRASRLVHETTVKYNPLLGHIPEAIKKFVKMTIK